MSDAIQQRCSVCATSDSAIDYIHDKGRKLRLLCSFCWIPSSSNFLQKSLKTHERIPAKFFTPTVLLKKGMAILIALALLLLVVWLAGAYDFWSALGVGYGMWLFIDWYDCFFLDWVLFANMKSVRLPGTEHMDAAYHQKKYHFVQSCWGMLIGLIPCLIGAALYAWLFC